MPTQCFHNDVRGNPLTRTELGGLFSAQTFTPSRRAITIALSASGVLPLAVDGNARQRPANFSQKRTPREPSPPESSSRHPAFNRTGLGCICVPAWLGLAIVHVVSHTRGCTLEMEGCSSRALYTHKPSLARHTTCQSLILGREFDLVGMSEQELPHNLGVMGFP